MDARADRPTLKDRSKEPRALIWFARILEEATGDARSKRLLAYPTSHGFTRQKHADEMLLMITEKFNALAPKDASAEEQPNVPIVWSLQSNLWRIL
jgi:hypothetical protein